MTSAGFGPDLVTMELSAAHLLDNRFHAFVFPALAPDPGGDLAFWLELPDATPTTTVAVWRVDSGEAACVQRYHDGRPVPGQLLCRVYEQAPAAVTAPLTSHPHAATPA
jgi:hypothetical protein